MNELEVFTPSHRWPMVNGRLTDSIRLVGVKLQHDLLLHCRRTQDKVYLVTGASEHCGTSTLVAHVAASLAEQHRLKILVVDANYDDPSQERLFSIDADALAKEKMDEKAKAKADVKTEENGATDYESTAPPPSIATNLHILGNKSVGSDKGVSALDYVCSKEFEQMLDRARRDFDLVLIDSASIAGAVETRLLCDYADNVMLVVAAEETRKEAVRLAVTRIQRSRANLLGVVLNRCAKELPKWLSTFYSFAQLSKRQANPAPTVDALQRPGQIR